MTQTEMINLIDLAASAMKSVKDELDFVLDMLTEEQMMQYQTWKDKRDENTDSL